MVKLLVILQMEEELVLHLDLEQTLYMEEILMEH